MGDGSRRNNGITLCTDNFSIIDIVMLINILIIKYDIQPTVHKEKDKYRIYINKKDYNKIIPSIEPYFVKSFRYKIYY